MSRLVLVVSDDHGSAQLLAELVRSHGYEPLCAAAVSEALYVLETRTVALVIAEHAMSGESGLALLRRMRRRPEWSVPAILLSAHDPDGSLARAAAEIGAELVPEPVDLARLAALVTRALGPPTGRTPSEVSTLPPAGARRGGIVEIVASTARKRDPRAE